MKTILTPIDFSGASDAVVAEAAALARAVRGRVILLTVVQPPIVTSEYTPMMDNLTEILAASETTAARNLAKIAARFVGDSVPVETVQGSGAPAAQILAHARRSAADYIVMGSHGHTALYDLLVGSTTHGVIKRARCPVVIVPPHDKERWPDDEAAAGRSEEREHTAAGAR